MGRLLVVSSGKGGVGKSTVAVGIATALGNSGQNVLLVDLDEGLRCLDLMLSVSDRLVFDVSDALNDPDAHEKSIYKVPNTENLWLMAAPSEVNSIDGESLGRFAFEISKKFDFVIFDCPAGLEPKYYASMPEFAEHIVVCNTDKVCVRDAFEMAEALSGSGRSTRLIINRFVKSRITKKYHKNIDGIIDSSGLQLLGVVPEDIYVMYAAANEVPIQIGPAAMAFHRIAARICGMTVPLKIFKD